MKLTSTFKWLAVPAAVLASHQPRAFAAWSPDAGQLDSIGVHAPLDLVQTAQICSYDAVVIAHQPGLDLVDLHKLSRSSPLASHINSSPSRLLKSYVPANTVSHVDLAAQIVRHCESQLLELSLGETTAGVDASLKHVISIDLPELKGASSAKKVSMSSIESHFSNQLLDISETFSSPLFILLGTSPNFLQKRQNQPSPAASPDAADPAATKKKPKKAPANGILKRYQLLTPGLITSLLIAFGVLLPFLFFSISALASIKSPSRMEAPKGLRPEKKTQ